MKIKRVISKRAVKRFKTMVTTALLVGVLSYVTDTTMSDVLSF